MVAGGGGGAVGKGKEDDLEEAYEILGISEEADEKEIQAGYRKGSLKCHPDRNPDDPEAAEKFDRLTRAKDLLLDPAKRAELDNKRKAKRDLEERFAQEDSKRRKLREDLESREDAASRGVNLFAPSAAELKKRAAQMDFAARIKAKQAEMAERQAEVAAEAEEARAVSEESRVRVTWRAGGAPVTMEVIRDALKAFEVRSIEMAESGAMVMLGSREDALRAVLHCRERKHQLPFRLALAAAKKATAADPSEAGASEKPSVASKSAAAAEPPLRQHKASAQASAKVPAASGFGDWEAQMLSGLAGLAAAQRASKAKT